MISVGDVLRYAWEVFRERAGLLVGLNLLLWILPALPTLVATQMVDEDAGSRFVLSLAGTLLGILVDIGWRRILLDLVDGFDVAVTDLFGQTRLLFRYFIASFANVLVLATPAVLLAAVGAAVVSRSGAMVMGLVGVVPMVYLGVRLSLWTFYMVDRDAGIVESLGSSWRVTGPVWLKLLVIYLALLVMIVVSMIPLGLGLLVSMPVASLAATRIYRDLVPARNGE